MARLLVLLLLGGLGWLGPYGALGTVGALGTAGPVCQRAHCRCSPAAHPARTAVTCRLTASAPLPQSLDLEEGDLPESTSDLLISGAETVVFAAHSLSRVNDLRHVRVQDARVVLMRRHAASELRVVSAYLDVRRVEVLRLEENSFSNIKGPLSVSLEECAYVSVERRAFSWLLALSVRHTRRLELGPGAFTLDPGAANVGEHGPTMTIELHNLTIPELSPQSFGSSAARIALSSVEVRTVRAGAFSANTYNSVELSNCSLHTVEGVAFAQQSLVNSLHFVGCTVHRLASGAIQSAVASLNISHSRFVNIEPGAINATVASATVLDSVFNNFKERGFELSSWNNFRMERNSFDVLASDAIVAPGTAIHELVFADNEIETAGERSLAFIGQVHAHSPQSIVFKSNYFGKRCNCNMTTWLSNVLGADIAELFAAVTYCTVDEFFARCFNVPEQNMALAKFLDGVCGESDKIRCETYKTKEEASTAIKNPRFPHKKDQEGVSDRNKKVIGIVIVTCIGCVVIALFISIIRWARRKGYCMHFKNFLMRSNLSCGTISDRLCVCGGNGGVDSAGSISQLSVNEYSERHRLNDHVQEHLQETTVPEVSGEPVATDDKTTQTLPEELTKELLENLREKLEDPENYLEAREMIEHLYELIKVEEGCDANTPTLISPDENVYDLPFTNTTPRRGKNNKQMVSVGTRAPSLDKLLPLSPYNRQTALAHEYFEPNDFAVHLYAEIANCNKERKALAHAMPDVVGDQAIPRGPYLRALRDKTSSGGPTEATSSPVNSSTMKSNKSITSNVSGRMLNRPLPDKPIVSDPGECTPLRLS